MVMSRMTDMDDDGQEKLGHHWVLKTCVLEHCDDCSMPEEWRYVLAKQFSFAKDVGHTQG